MSTAIPVTSPLLDPSFHSVLETPIDNDTLHLQISHNLNNTLGYLLEPSKNGLIQTSPYKDPAHLLDLRSLSKECALMAEALTTMKVLTAKYATAAYVDAFNWQEIVDTLRVISQNKSHGVDENYVYPNTSFYVIVFLSRVPETTNRDHLGLLDAEAHREAVKGGGLLKYWFGTPDEAGRNLATCLWRNRDDAKLGGAGPGHLQAMKEARRLYQELGIQRLRFAIGEGAKSWDIIEWID